jgi:uncharacterized membrane protein YfcA
MPLSLQVRLWMLGCCIVALAGAIVGSALLWEGQARFPVRLAASLICFLYAALAVRFIYTLRRAARNRQNGVQVHSPAVGAGLRDVSVAEGRAGKPGAAALPSSVRRDGHEFGGGVS